MNRMDFMRQLESLLQNISFTEREEALQYYNDYFDDAGEENEQSVIEALGTPAKVAENIKKDLYGSGYGEQIYQSDPSNDRAIVEYYHETTESSTEESGMSTGVIVLIVVLCVFASPILIGIASAVLAFFAAWFSMILAFGAVALALLVMMMVLFGVGIISMFSAPLEGILVEGIGLILGGLGILFLMLTVAMAGIATPAICKGIAGLCRMMFGKKKNV